MTNSPNYLVFFDVDGTLLNIKSMFSFLKYFYANKTNNNALAGFKYRFYLVKIFILKLIGTPREKINKDFYKNFSGVSVSEMMSLGEKWWEKVSQSRNIYKFSVIKEMIAHQENGAEIILVSGSMPACISPFARKLKVNNFLLTSLEIKSGSYTGNIQGVININQGKRIKIQEFLNQYPNPVNLAHCYAYGDHKSDLPMLQMVGNPVVINGDDCLMKMAKQNGWRVIN